MKRLTLEKAFGNVPVLYKTARVDGHVMHREKIDIRVFENENKIKYPPTDIYENYLCGSVIDKLADYEDAEEQGLLLRLPCNIGDTIFVIPSKINFKLNVLNGYQNNNKVYAQVVCNFVLTKYGLMINTCDGFCHVRDTERGETWFLTMEEAAAALKKMQEDKE